ncbi:hypothetical protein BOTBODRAFT_31765 [Botryobasidium botryosum FD-172 SS1]|uniref:ATP-dependent RNA helicase DBP8 n=1 Tax=Botryobasidium botryosum (strain FD-172 SS1) TaxID=930990 RepID=A0A067MV58_BOTB1|nr:hypothetical protein BOTBODRAFT_31765 [Botryobasidium botryosum FD-172 SS1]
MANSIKRAVSAGNPIKIADSGDKVHVPLKEDAQDHLSSSGSEESGSDDGGDDSGHEADDSNKTSAQPVYDDEDEEDVEPEQLTSSVLPNRISFAPRAQLSKPLRSSRPLPPKPGNPSQPTAQATFHSLGISSSLVSALNAMSIRHPTPIQSACIPPLLAGRDCIGNAKTGSGKTIAFALPILQKLLADPFGIFALILTPTRELAFQIAEQFSVIGAPLNARTSVIVGGMDMIKQALELTNRPHVVIATPGRLVDHLNSANGEWDLRRVKFLVLDEADRILTPTFASDLGMIFAALPQERQTCLFTATLTPSIEALAAAPPRAGKQKPVLHRDTSSVETVDTLKQHYMLVPSHIREAYLYHLLCNPPESVAHLRREPPAPTPKAGKGARNAKQHDPKRSKKPSAKSKSVAASDPDSEIKQPPPTIIFVRHPRIASYLTTLLQHLGIRSTALHSHLSQPARLASLNLFRASVVPVLVCTDVGARGLDMDDVAMVINWDLPSGEGGAEEYVHRVGRTARMGRGGIAISFVTEREGDDEIVQGIEERIRIKLTEYTLPEDKVLEKLNLVSTAKRTANMELHDSDFGKRQEIHRKKRAKLAEA